MKSSALGRQVGGSHYKKLPLQPIQFAEVNQLTGLQTKVVKYLTRHQSKHGLRDVQAAIHCVDLMLELASGDWIENIPLLSPDAKSRLRLSWSGLRSARLGTCIEERYFQKLPAIGSHLYTSANRLAYEEARVIMLTCEKPTETNVLMAREYMLKIIERDYSSKPKAES